MGSVLRPRAGECVRGAHWWGCTAAPDPHYRTAHAYASSAHIHTSSTDPDLGAHSGTCDLNAGAHSSTCDLDAGADSDPDA